MKITIESTSQLVQIEAPGRRLSLRDAVSVAVPVTANKEAN